MPEFRQGQLVAVWDREDCDRFIRIFVCREEERYRCRLPGIEFGDPDFEIWEHCIPLEDVAPEAFLAREKTAEVLHE